MEMNLKHILSLPQLKRLLFIAFLASYFGYLPSTVAAETDLAFVVVDNLSTSRLGPMPIDRKAYAEVINSAKISGARAVVVKFFFDEARPSDTHLATAMQGLPVYLQVAFNERDDGQSTLSSRFFRSIPAWQAIQRPLIAADLRDPVQALAAAAQGVGSVHARVDGKYDRIESFTVLRDKKILPSLQLITAELVLQAEARVSAREIHMGKKTFPLDSEGRIICPYLSGPSPITISIEEILRDGFNKDLLRNKVVVIGYARDDAPTLDMGSGTRMNIHELFFRQVRCLTHG